MKRNMMILAIAGAAVVFGTVFTTLAQPKPATSPAPIMTDEPKMLDVGPVRKTGDFNPSSSDSSAIQASRPTAKAAPLATSPASAKDVEAALNKNVPKLDLTNIELKDAIEFIRVASEANVVVHWAALQGAGIEQTTPVTVRLNNTTVAQILDTILGALSTNVLLDYIVKDGMVIISTSDDLCRDNLLVTEVYNVSDMVDWSEEGQMTSLMENIRGNVLPDSWKPAGTIGSMTSFKGMLTVRQSYKGQKAIKALLEQLRKVSAEQRTSSRPSIFTADQARQAEMKTKVVISMKETCFDPEAFAIVALGGLRSDARYSPHDLAKQLEEFLAWTKSQGLRNAIRLNLKDIYGELGDQGKVQQQYVDMFRENDEYLQKQKAPQPPK